MTNANRQMIFAILVAGLMSLPQRSIAAETDPAAPPTPEQIHTAIERSLPYLEQAGLSWMESKKCVSCHRVGFLTWSFSEASRKGYKVDRQKLQDWIDWSVTKSLEDRGEGKPVDATLNFDGIAQMVLGHSANAPAPLSQETSATFVRLLLQGQQPDGSWKPAGQLPAQKRPKDETTQVSTMWIALALGSSAPTEELHPARGRALGYLETAVPGKSTEWYAAGLLLRLQQQDETRVKSAIEQLKSKQHADGGWGWLVDDKSDAIASGQALYALSIAGIPADDPSIKQAEQFLISTQLENGSWAVNGTKENKQGHVEETASYWGTAWATLGLLQTSTAREP